ncbi:MAG TPA: hypothetical protein VE397_10660 [Stellaceae bacterium]|jgi:hypothetical protein|nr:hypothetical protein [Stellaceae bacterium]
MRCFIAGAAIAALLAGCVPMIASDLPNGDHVVTTYVRLQGGEEARDDNLWAARQTCHGGVVLIREDSGIDDYGAWHRLVFGCLAEASGSSASR